MRLLITLLFLLLIGCSTGPRVELTREEQIDIIRAAVESLEDVMVHDVLSPPLVSRNYTYPLIAYYEVVRHTDEAMLSFAGQLNELERVPAPASDQEYHWLLAGTHAFRLVAEELVFSRPLFSGRMDEVMARFDAQRIPADVYRRSLRYGEAVARHILEWCARDSYKETRSMARYALLDTPGSWRPTGPDYMAAVEPYWAKIRPFAIASTDQFIPDPPHPFELSEGSSFFREVKEVYEVSRNLTKEQREIANFWDCNPFVMHHMGHLSFGLTKMSPGAHWIALTGNVAAQNQDSPARALAALGKVSVAIADAFMVSWDEKYRSNLIRPETVIREHLDPTWTPMLQTPPFPEYTSGHSTISTAAAVVLTSLYGDSFAFTDTAPVKYGTPPRQFNSFYEAAEEAAISRLYGGIHYMQAITEGVKQGRQVGETVLLRVSLQQNPSLKIVGYTPGWQPIWEEGAIDAGRLTHINFAFANIRDGEVVLGNDGDEEKLAVLRRLRDQHPHLRTLISVGGWSWSTYFSDAALNDSTRERFASSAVRFMKEHGLDGVDIDWEYPAQIGNNNIFRPEDRENFTLLLKALREELDAQSILDGRGADRYLLTIATGASDTFLANTEMDLAQEYLDFVNIMTYDFSGAWTPVTGHHANLYRSSLQPEGGISAASGVEAHIRAGVPPEKLVLGVPFYGRGWKGVQDAYNGMAQPYTGESSSHPFHALIEMNGYTRHWDEEAQAPFLWNPETASFITYEDEESLNLKVQFIRERGLAGAMFWAYGQDHEGRLLGTLAEGLLQ